MITAIGSFGVLWLLGALALDIGGVRRPGGQQVAADFAAGTGILAFVGSVAVVSGVRLSILPVYAILIVLSAVAWRRRARVGISGVWPRDPIAAALLGATGAAFLLLAVSSLGDRLWWDGWVIWALKARVLFLEETLPRAFLDPRGDYAFSHPGYPLALPLENWWLYRHAGEAAPALASLSGTLWLAFLSLMLWEALRARVGERVAALAALGVTTFWPLAVHAAGGTADVVIALALLGAITELEDGLARRDHAALWRCGVFLSLGAMAKTEGLALALIAAAVGVVTLLRDGERRVRKFLPFALPFVLAAPWQAFVLALGLGREFLDLSLGPKAMGERIILTVGAFGHTALAPPWLPLAILAGLGVLRRTASAGWLVLVGYVVAIATAYVLRPFDLIWLVDRSLWRVLGACVPAVLYLSLSGAAAAVPGEDAAGHGVSRMRSQVPAQPDGGVHGVPA